MVSKKVGKREEQRKLKLCVLSKIKGSKHILFGPFSAKVTKNTRSKAWKEIGHYARLLGLIREDKPWTYMRDVWWTNVRKLSMEKQYNVCPSGTGEGPELKIDELDELVYDILDKNSPNLEDLSVEESSKDSHETEELCEIPGPSYLQVKKETIIDEEYLNQETSLPETAEFSVGGVVYRDVDESRRVNSSSHTVVGDDLVTQKLKLSVEVLEKESKLKDLQMESAEKVNYLKDLKILQLELQYGLPRSKHTRHFRV